MGKFSAVLLLVFTASLSGMSCLDDTIYIREWYFCGPFSLGAREGVIGVDPEIEIDPRYTPDTTKEYVSMLAPGGMVRWEKLISDSGEIHIVYDKIPWDTIQDYYGVAGVSCGTYAYGEFPCSRRCRALVMAQGVSSFKLNGCSHPGDAYQDGFLQVPVVLDSGVNRILLKLSGYSTHCCFLKINPCKAPLHFVNDITKPDIIRGELSKIWLGIPLLNTTDAWMTDVRLHVTGQFVCDAMHHIPAIAPLGAIKVPIAIDVRASADLSDDSVQITLNITLYNTRVDTSLWLYVKDKQEAHVRTFLSRIDNSCQYYAVLAPEDYQENTAYACIMTCHGAGVRAENQIKVYQQKEWAFVVAPTNRRRYGFDWQDWGRLDFLEVLEQVKNHYEIDENRIYLTGHSMGGHGVWHIATMHPDLFAAIATSAGWISFQLYIPWFLQKSEIFAHPDLLRHRDMALRADNPLTSLENLEHVPVYILHGGADDNVPAIQGRMFAKYLNVLGFEHMYHEVPGQGHWWNIDSTPGVDCVDLEEMMEFLRRHTRNAVSNKNGEFKKEEITIKHAYFSPFMLIYGTIGDSLSSRNNFAQARMQSYVWWYRANGYVEILPDTEVTSDIIKDYNLVVFGNAETNSVLKWINHKLPVRVERESIIINNQRLIQKNLCLIEIYPNPLNSEKYVLVYSATSAEAEKLMGFFMPLHTGAGLPDYIVYDKSVLVYGWGGVIAAGFFDREWKFDARRSTLKK